VTDGQTDGRWRAIAYMLSRAKNSVTVTRMQLEFVKSRGNTNSVDVVTTFENIFAVLLFLP